MKWLRRLLTNDPHTTLMVAAWTAAIGLAPAAAEEAKCKPIPRRDPPARPGR